MQLGFNHVTTHTFNEKPTVIAKMKEFGSWFLEINESFSDILGIAFQFEHTSYSIYRISSSGHLKDMFDFSEPSAYQFVRIFAFNDICFLFYFSKIW